MSALKYWLWLTELPGLTNQTRLALLQHFPTPEDVYYAEAAEVLRCRDALLAQRGMLSAMALAAERLGSRGSGAVLGPDGAVAPEAADARRQLVETEMTGLCCRSWLREVRPLPQPDNWFERVWEAYRARNGA